jgi:hypothetical protein
VLAQVWDEEENLVESKCSVCITLAYLQVNLEIVQQLGRSMVANGCSGSS